MLSFRDHNTVRDAEQLSKHAGEHQTYRTLLSASTTSPSKKEAWGFPGAQGSRTWGYRFNPWTRKSPHPMRQLSPWAPTTEPVLQSPCSVMRVTPAPHDWRKPVCSIEDPEQPKINKNYKKKNGNLLYSGGRRPREKEKKEGESPVLRFSAF